MDDLLKRAAEKMGMPPALAERSAQARAEKEGTTVEAVLAEWAGESVDESPTATAAEPEATESDASESAPQPATPSADAPTEVTTDYLVNLAAASKRMPPKLVRSSAEARARNSNSDLDTVLATWAGVDLAELKQQVADGTAPVPDVSGSVPASAEAPPAPPSDDAPQPEPVAPAAETQAEPAAPVAASAAGAALSMDELLEKVAEAKGMPAPIAKRSAEARAKKTGEPLEAVLAEWAGIDPGDLAAAPAEAPVAAEPPPSPAPAQAAGAAPAGGTMSMDELLEKVAEAKGMPAPIAKRSAEARAKKTGEPLEAVLAEWAGIDPAAVAAAPATAAAAPAPSAAASAEPTPVEAAPEVEVIEASAPAVVEPDLVDADEESIPTRGYPAWLAAAFVIIPLLAVAYILITPNGPDCGVAGQLRIDEATGLAVNCDGSEYGSSSVDFLAIGSGQYAACAACHGGNGEGGVGPAFSGGAVLATFPGGSCSDHIEWIRLGTAGWPDDTYGATGKPVGGGGNMPAFPNLTDEQLAAVALYERVQFGGQDLEQAELDCGLVEAEDGESGETEEMVEAGG